MVKRIVLTGGPGSGKTSVLEKINQVYSSQGYKVIIVPETATELMNNGVTFKDGRISLVDFQELVMRLQLAKEEVVDRTIELLGEHENVIVVYDRGTIDNTAYINKEEFEEILARLNNVKSFTDLLNKYDLVINLVGREDFYTTDNNKARSESSSEALKLGDATLKCWLGHKTVKIVMPKDTVEEKISEVLNIINDSLALKQVKRQAKYLVDLSKTDIDFIREHGKAMHIEQTYLASEKGVEKRVRKVAFNDCVYYLFSVFKIQEDGSKVIVSEKQVDKKLYESLLEFKDTKCVPIRKIRYYFAYRGEYFNLDVFEDNRESAILEINLGQEEDVTIPDYVSVLEMVSNNEMYFNRNIAREKYKKMEKKHD